MDIACIAKTFHRPRRPFHVERAVGLLDIVGVAGNGLAVQGRGAGEQEEGEEAEEEG